MRPKSIVAFEGITLLSIGLGIANMYLSFDRFETEVSDIGLSIESIITGQAVTVAILLLLILLISRGRNKVAKWIYVILTLSGTLFAIAMPPPALHYGPAIAALTIVQYALSIAACWLLFRSDANRWFRGEGEVDPSTFR